MEGKDYVGAGPRPRREESCDHIQPSVGAESGQSSRLGVKHAIDDRRLNRVELEVFDFNLRARHVYEKVGFQLEGTRRQALRSNDEWIDAHVMAVVASDWQAP